MIFEAASPSLMVFVDKGKDENLFFDFRSQAVELAAMLEVLSGRHFKFFMNNK